MEIFNLLFSFGGRINRAKFWLITLTWTVVWVAGVLLLFVTEFSTVLIVIAIIVIIPSVISGAAAGVRRLHDRDKSGWWLVLFYLAPVVLDGIGRSAGSIGIVFSVISFAISVWAFVELGCLRGTIAGNRYGPDPVAPKPAHH